MMPGYSFLPHIAMTAAPTRRCAGAVAVVAAITAAGFAGGGRAFVVGFVFVVEERAASAGFLDPDLQVAAAASRLTHFMHKVEA